jgi:hypothetical protein
MEVSDKRTVTLTADEVNKIILDHIGAKDGNVNYVIEEVGGDPMDRFPGTDTVTKVRVTYDITKEIK